MISSLVETVGEIRSPVSQRESSGTTGCKSVGTNSSSDQHTGCQLSYDTCGRGDIALFPLILHHVFTLRCVYLMNVHVREGERQGERGKERERGRERGRGAERGAEREGEKKRERRGVQPIIYPEVVASLCAIIRRRRRSSHSHTQSSSFLQSVPHITVHTHTHTHTHTLLSLLMQTYKCCYAFT